ncbi:MAG TPA: hypothetical protein VGU71_20795 [Candidatus Dormibacteraeota bacterium]|nr:hypothetical protein [Candidatus Dormibacteraeota bacterium]
MRLTRLVHMLTPLGIATIVAGSLAVMPAVTASAAKGDGTVSHLTAAGTGTLGSPAASSSNGNTPTEIGPQQEVDQKAGNASTTAHLFPTVNPNPKPNGIASSNPGATGFDALNHFDTRNASGGNQFSLEPPDQGLCVSSTYVVEAINDVMAVYRTSDHKMVSGPTALNAFFQVAPSVIRTPGQPNGPYGPFITDPKCYFDASTNRWFLTVAEIDLDPQTGAFGTKSALLIAVSNSGDPREEWHFYRIDTTDASNPICATGCFGDQPLIGADQNGFYITTNEFPITANGFNGAQVYAISKSQLVRAAEDAGPTPAFVHINAGAIPSPDGPSALWYSIQPATSPASGGGGDSAAQPSEGTSGRGGVEYFLSALQFGPSPLDNRIAAWALTNTSSLGEDPNVKLSVKVIRSETYGQPPDATQRPGVTPLGTALGEPLILLAGNDDRMNQVVFANGLLWSGVNTVVQAKNGPPRVGIAYFVVRPSSFGGHLSASMANQGYVSAAGENVLFPSIGVNAQGLAIMSFSLSGPHFFPSAAYAAISAEGGAGNIHISGAGAMPDDGFTGYVAFGGAGTGRWGDYSAAVAAPDGSIWMAAEYIPNRPRTTLANWGTFITKVTFGEGDSQNQN